MIKSALSALLLGLLLLLSSDVGRTPARSQGPEASGEDVLFNTTLLGRARKAKEKGLTKVTFPGPVIRKTKVGPWDDVISTYSIVVARPLEKRSLLLDTHHVGTFYKLKVVEKLSGKGVRAACCGLPDSLPAQLPPLGSGEMYVLMSGGTVMLEGVEVTQTGLFSDISLSEPYLFFLSQDASGQVGIVKLGKEGILKLDAGGRLGSLDDKPHKIKTYLDGLYGSSLRNMREDLKSRGIF